MTIPQSVKSHFEHQVDLKTMSVLVQLDVSGQVCEIDRQGGSWELGWLKKGSRLPDALAMLVESSEGDQWLYYEFVELLNNQFVELHVLRGESHTHIILFDANRSHEIEQNLRQRANEISMLLERQAAFRKVLEGLNKQLEIKKAEADHSRDLAENANRAKSDFLSSMSHEIRTPINAIIGMTTLLCDEDLTDRSREFAMTIQQSGRLLMALIEGILDFSKIESDKLEITAAPSDIRRCMNEALELFHEEAAAKGLKLEVKIGDIPDSAIFDAPHLRQVLVNLLSNAIKFTPSGKVCLSVSSKTYGDDTLTLSFVVADTGIGISADRLAAAFEPFDQIETSIRDEYGGTGLGLTISKRLVELMGGKIRINSSLGEGTTVGFEILAQEDNITGKVRSMGIRNCRQTTEFDHDLSAELPLRILVVDDNTINRQILCLLLGKMGYTADEVADGDEAVTAAGQKSYDLIFMDVRMPRMSGIEATRLIRKQGSGGMDISIVGLTAEATLEAREKCLLAGMNEFVTKPVLVQDLEAALRRAAQ